MLFDQISAFSTEEQNLDFQRDALIAICRQRGWEEFTIDEDMAFGADFTRGRWLWRLVRLLGFNR